MKRILLLLGFVLFSIYNPFVSIKAQEFKIDYKVDYYLNTITEKPSTKVKFQVDIKNSSSDAYIKNFSLKFPNAFKISNATALYNEPLTPEIISSNDYTEIKLEFPKGVAGKDAASSIYIDFDQENIFQINGNLWEVILPTLEVENGSTYKVNLHLPEGENRKLSISKPKPTKIDGNLITWDNPADKTISATFGDSQIYNTTLKYHLENDGLRRVYTEIAFPPDTAYQKVYVSSIVPQPAEIYIDEDGNYIGKYYLGPKEKKDIVFNGALQVLNNPRDELIAFDRKIFNTQKKYLLNSNKYWNVDVNTDLNSPQEIFDYITNLFQYDVSLVNSNKKRVGATQALKYPDKVVCTEYTDTFIALARQKGIYSREMQGYGYSDDETLRPISLNSDVLHAWPEYFDSASSQWIPIDPTWEDTSGIDYFSSFDLNHLVFAIHGKNPEYPLPAGTYKREETKDVSVKPTDILPEDIENIYVQPFSLSSNIIGDKTYTDTLIIENKGNTFRWNIPLILTSDNLNLKNKNITIDALAPFEKRKIAISYTTPKVGNNIDAYLVGQLNGKQVLSSKTMIIPYYYDTALKVGAGIIAFTLLLTVFRLLIKRLIK